MTEEREDDDVKPPPFGPSKKSQIIVMPGQRPSRAKRSCSSPAATAASASMSASTSSSRHGYQSAELTGLDRPNASFHSSWSSAIDATKKHHRRVASSSSAASWKCEGATTEDSGLDQFIAANNRDIVFDFVNSFSLHSRSKTSLLLDGEEDEEDEDEKDEVTKPPSSLRVKKSAPPPRSLVSNLKPPPPSSLSTSETTTTTSTSDEDCDVENQRATTFKSPSKDVSISKREVTTKKDISRQLERARVLASVEERQREVAVKTLLFFALVISLFVLNQRIRSTTPGADGSDTGTYYATMIEHMLAGIERIRNEQQDGPD